VGLLEEILQDLDPPVNSVSYGFFEKTESQKLREEADNLDLRDTRIRKLKELIKKIQISPFK